jgi:ring-1,2-phenylacetyl-CoA epoxidase subunit PaaE
MPKPQFHQLRVADVEQLTDDSVAITFDVPPELAEAYRFKHGQHLTIRGDDGERRSFSICTTPSSGALTIGVKKLPGGAFSEGVVGTLHRPRAGSPPCSTRRRRSRTSRSRPAPASRR